jgi:hypothetical protein
MAQALVEYRIALFISMILLACLNTVSKQQRCPHQEQRLLQEGNKLTNKVLRGYDKSVKNL